MEYIKSKYNALGENSRIVLKNVISSFMIKGFALIISFLTIPAYMRFFHNKPVLGLWYTILSVLNWVLYFDFGIGNGLRNHLTKTLSTNNDVDSKKYLSSAYISTGILAIVIAIVFIIGARFVNWNYILKIDSNLVDSNILYIAIVICLIGIDVQLFLRNISSVLYALQKSFLNNFLSLCTSIIIYFFVVFAKTGSNEENLLYMSVVYTLAVTMPLFITTMVLFFGKLKKVRPDFKSFSFKHTKDVLGLGIAFLFAQMAYMFIMNTNEVQITHFTNTKYVVDYQAYFRLFSLGGTVFTLALVPVWSAITKAKTEGDIIWIKKTYYLALCFAFVGSLFEVAISIFAEPLMKLWLREQMIESVHFHVSIQFAILGSAMMFNGAISSVANGLGDLKRQVVCYGLGAIFRIPLSYLLVIFIGDWSGIVLSNIICIIIYCIVESLHFHKVLSRKKEATVV